MSNPDPASFAVTGVRVGHWSDVQGRTGCTVIDLPPGTVASYEARGGAPASRELEVLAPDKAVTAIDAVLLTGGSAFGLAAADGVMQHYRALGRGLPTPAGPVPIVPTLALFDLTAGDSSASPNAEAGRTAAKATRGPQILRGRIGAGTGAHVSHWRGPHHRHPGGLAYAEHRLAQLVVACVCVVNAYGDIDNGHAPISFDAVRAIGEPFEFNRAHTTIGLIATNANLDKVGCKIVAQGAHDGLARALTPPHTRYDGDGFIAAATGTVDTHIDTVRLLALACVTDAIRSLAP